MENRPSVGLAVFIQKDGKFLFGKRTAGVGRGLWGLTGGHLEYNESWEECAKRETLEEAGINIKNIRFCGVTNDRYPEHGKHYITIFMICDYDSGEVRLMEPDKFEKWEWHGWDEMPQPLFSPIEHLIATGFKPG